MDSTEVKGQSAKYEPLGTSQSWPGAAAISSQKTVPLSGHRTEVPAAAAQCSDA